MLAAGTTLGPYKIIAPLGAGGMGEVYRAHDSRLGRDVAIKVLPQHLSDHPEVRARFEREAKTISSLNHPNICTLHDIGREGDTDYLVMELIEGETLSARLAKGALPVQDVLRIGAQVAEALDRAHRAGVVHRDLKPANVMLTKTGAKLMDFGLARGASGPVGPVSGSGATMTALSMSPTMATPLTAQGAIVGTFQYMSPEQLEGKEADTRSDLWALGCVLYEMATGKRAFDGKSQASLIGAIMTTEPPALSTLAPMSPPALERLVQQCLAKDPDDRWQSASDLRRQLLYIAEPGSQSGAKAVPPAPRAARGGAPAWITAAALIAGVAIGWRVLPMLGSAGGKRSDAGSGLVTGVTQLTDLPGNETAPVLSPDGKSLLFVAHAAGGSHIYVQRVGGENPIDLSASSDAIDREPAFSPDGEHIAFVSIRDGGGIFVMGATGESPKKIVSEGAHPAWSPDGKKLVYCTEHIASPFGRNTTSSLWVVDVASGEKKRIYAGDAVQPQWSPSGKRIVFWAADRGQRDIRTIPADGGTAVPVTADLPADWAPFWAPDGRMVYFFSDRGGSRDLWRVAIDEASGKVHGAPEAVTTGVTSIMAGSISSDGKRVAVQVETGSMELLRGAFDPVAGRPVGEPVRFFQSSKSFGQDDLSQDAQWLTTRTVGGHEDLMVMRTDGSKRLRLMDDEFRDRGPKWIRGDDWLVFYSNRGGEYQIWLIRADGTDARPLTASNTGVNLPAVSPDGSKLAFSASNFGGTTQKDGLAIVPVQANWFAATAPAPLTEFKVTAEHFTPLQWSPDGKYIVGYEVDAKGGAAAVYSMATNQVAIWPGSSTIAAYGVTWLPDSRRVLAYDRSRGSAVLLDAQTMTEQQVPGMLGPCTYMLTADGRTVYMDHNIDDGDIWMLTLR